MGKELNLYEFLPHQLNDGNNHLDADCAEQGGLFGMIDASSLIITRSLISVNFGGYLSSDGSGLLAVSVCSS